jgi:hypothetical protein
MKSRYMFGGWLFPALRHHRRSPNLHAMARLARRHIRAKRI